MSYIRSVNNPEGLYIYGNEIDAEIRVGPDYIGRIPIYVLDGLIKAYWDNNMEDAEFEGVTIRKVWVNQEGVVADPEEIDPIQLLIIGFPEPKMMLAYEDWHLFMWGVTWDWIVYSEITKHLDRG